MIGYSLIRGRLKAVPKRKYYCITKLGLHTLQEKWKEWDQITEIVNAYRGGKENE